MYYTLSNIDHLLLDSSLLQKHFQSYMALVLDALVVPRTDTLAADWLQLTELGAMLIDLLGCSVTAHPLKGIILLASVEVSWALISCIVLEQNETTFLLRYESYEGHCSSLHFHPLILTLSFLSADS